MYSSQVVRRDVLRPAGGLPQLAPGLLAFTSPLSSAQAGTRSASACASDELRLDGAVRGRAGLRFDLGEEQTHAESPEFGEVLPDGGQRRLEELRLGDVVEAHDADVTGHVASALVE